jgi:diguanylate cyclase (GGDEF)-like protein
MGDDAPSSASVGDEPASTVLRAGASSTRLGDDETAAAWFHRIAGANVVGIGYGVDGIIVDANDALTAAVGARPGDFDIGVPAHELFQVDEQAIEGLFEGGSDSYDIKRLDGSPAHVLASRIRLGPGEWLLITVDLTDMKAAERAVRHLALHDATTGVPNRRLLMDRLEHALARARRQGSVVGVLFCDVDRFKSVNDTFGHRAGDSVLQTAARRLQSVLRQYDTVARVGGDEFVVLLESLADPTDATYLAERARLAVAQPIEIGDRTVSITASIGVAVTNDCSDTADSLLRRADDAMYLAKRNGRNQVAFSAQDFS